MDRMIKRANNNITIVGFLLIVVAVVMMCILYIGELQAVTGHEIDRYLMEVTQHLSHAVNYKISVNHQVLSQVGETYMGMDNAEEGMWFLKNKAEELDCVRIGVCDRNFQYYTPDGYHMDVSDYAFVRQALEGQESASEILQLPIDGQDTILYSVPLRENGEITGALVAVKSKEQLQQSLDINSFEGRGFAYMIDCDGNFIMNSSNAPIQAGQKNFFDTVRSTGRVEQGYSLEGMQQQMWQRGSGQMQYTLSDGVTKVVDYVPLDVDGWYLLSVVPLSVTDENVKTLIHWTVLLCSFIVLLFVALLGAAAKMQKKNRQYLEQLAYVDPITGGFNKARFEQEAERVIRNAPVSTYAMVSLDIEQFKLINDTFGSEMGNKTLRHVYDTIQKHLKPGEFAARCMADNFMVLIKNCPPGEMIARFDQIAEEVNCFNDSLQQKYFIMLAEGIYIIDEPALDMITIQDRAVVARRNKPHKTGTMLNSCLFYTDMERRKMIREKEIENRMESALKHGEFVIYMQPKIHLRTGKVSSAEALVRWQDPERGMLAPAEFIPIFEKNEFVTKIDLFVFEQTCKTIRRWMEQGWEPVPVSMNLSSVHLKHPDFLKKFEAVYQKYKIPPQLLEIELTETLVFENMDALMSLIEQIHALGFRFSLDDFGSGYSSLNILKEIHADTLKIDRAFFREESQDQQRGRFIVENVIELARKLHMQTVAEGVETIPQVEFLKKAGCDMIQGFVYSGPVPLNEFEKMAFLSGQ